MQTMRKPRKSRAKKVGLPPGSLVHLGEIRSEQTNLTLFRYDTEHLAEQRSNDLAGLDLQPLASETLWLNIHGLHDAALMAKIGERFNLHPLVLEDILNTDQRPKVESYDGYLFLVTRFFSYDRSSMLVTSEQISIVFGRGFVLTFQEQASGSFEPVRERLRANKGPTRAEKADYLAYSLLDIIVDRYFIVLEQLGDDCEALEEELLSKPTTASLRGIHKLRRETMDLRRSVWPLREVVNALTRNESGFFQPNTLLYLRDVYDHLLRIFDSANTVRDNVSSAVDLFFSAQSQQLNQYINRLTLITIGTGILAVVTGFFGMNFQQMWPIGFDNPNGVFFVIAAIVLTIAILWFILERQRRQ